jgi:hypothetical protein
MDIIDQEWKNNLSRYYHLVGIFDKLLNRLRIDFNNNPLWFYYAEKLARKLLTHCKSLCLNVADTFMFEETQDTRQAEYMDIPGIFTNVRLQSDAYATLYHLFFDNRGFGIKRLRFDLWRLDGLSEWSKQNRTGDLSRINEQTKEITSIILANEEYNRLTEAQKKLIFTQDDNNIYANWKFIPEKLGSKKDSKVHWKDIFLNTGLKGEIFNNAHAFFSMYVHSNFFSVNHLENLSKPMAVKDKTFALTFSCFLIAFTIDDFCSAFKEAKEFSKSLSSLDKEIIKSFLVGGRIKEKIRFFIAEV